MSDKLAVLMEFNGYTKDELEAYLSLKFGSMTKGGMTASILSQSGYEKAKSVIFGQPQLNENQQIVLDWLKLQAPTAKPMQVIFWMMNNAAWGKLDELRKPIMHLKDKQQAQVLEEFGKWAQEQEEE